MTDRAARTVVRPSPQPGTGILHPFPTADLPHIDPFVFLDTGAPRNLGAADIYVGPHPHRGVQPVSLLFRGRISHRDSLGNERTVESGGIQWLVAGQGALHEEVLGGDDDGVFHMAQLWVNVPSQLKMNPPEHHAVPANDVPVITDLGKGSTFRLYAGSISGKKGPAPLPTPLLVGHLALDPKGSATLPTPRQWTAAFTVVAGNAIVSGLDALEPGATVVFGNDGDTITVSSDAGAELLVMCGKPIGEQISMGGGFVMNTPDEIDVAFDDFRSGLMGQLAPSR
jgi:redox-sensitive bicupin YhaK (pirin superfamily)